ncbi:hypothetical protein K9M59_04395 [Candidatus Gracilibacteria bacterium]|nr:hypothetical protein [Candidatus Gracilibacteria bacterium]MCF7819559.1 hypothetical protein [Candidatus Gracilibacteria bacterium]
MFLWFGIQKWVDPLFWMGFLPASLEQGFGGISGQQWLAIAGAGEILLALLLLVPKTRFWAASLLSLHLVHILFVVGFSDIGIRDIGLLSATLSLSYYFFPYA